MKFVIEDNWIGYNVSLNTVKMAEMTAVNFSLIQNNNDIVLHFVLHDITFATDNFNQGI